MRFILLFKIRSILFSIICKNRFIHTFCFYEHASASMTQIIDYSAIVKGIKVCIQIVPDFQNTRKNQDIAGLNFLLEMYQFMF